MCCKTGLDKTLLAASWSASHVFCPHAARTCDDGTRRVELALYFRKRMFFDGVAYVPARLYADDDG